MEVQNHGLKIRVFRTGMDFSAWTKWEITAETRRSFRRRVMKLEQNAWIRTGQGWPEKLFCIWTRKWLQSQFEQKQDSSVPEQWVVFVAGSIVLFVEDNGEIHKKCSFLQTKILINSENDSYHSTHTFYRYCRCFKIVELLVYII